MSDIERQHALVTAEHPERQHFLDELNEGERDLLESYWPLWARREQMPPAQDWQLWLICVGRGFGKTRAGAEWVRHVAEEDPNARIALVTRSIAEARAVMVEGESGILACHLYPDGPEFEPSLRRLTWPNGAQATLYSASEPESLRGPQHGYACRPGAKGTHHQRIPRPAGCAAAPGCRGPCR
ncbi:terminase large subunit domain-containing protein [Aurantiacibacter hainanensis]|uniref:terminase large subunit domain-containing protein n=1 Tax=Aurantiacibacter hainanensis TaxID=3076114 RepID=UPI003EC1020B